VFLKMTITRMCYIFWKIPQKKTIDENELRDLHKFMVETQNQLGDMFTFRFFFDIMPHLMIHMVHLI
jgi:hypothetical protein